jgi:PAS domain S-box-containing protein
MARKPQPALKPGRPEGPAEADPADAKALLHDLRVHQAELEAQNEELRQARSRLEQALERYADLYDTAPVGYVTLDPSGRVLEINSTAATLVGRERERLLGSNFRDRVDADDRGVLSLHLGRAARERGRTETELLLARTEPLPVLLSTVPVKDPEGRWTFRTALTDLTGQKKIQEVLRQSEQRYRIMGEILPYGVWFAAADGTLQYVSPSFLELVDLTLEDLGDFGWTKRLPPGHHEPTLEKRNRCLATGEEWENEYRVTDQSGRELVILSRGRPVRDEDGRISGWAGIHLDITGRKRAEEELHRAREDAQAANRAKSDFLARMSHEIRTPMNGIMGMTELALMEEALPQRVREYLGMAKQSAKGLLEIINDVLDIARIEAGRVELDERPFDVTRTVRDLLSPFALAAERKGLRLSQSLGRGLPDRVMGDEGRLRQVLTNLVGNALKFAERGEVEVTVRRSAEPAEPGHVRLLFGVRDEGIGIPAENLATMFESFTQATHSTHAKYGGTGLGLSIARQLVELMGGRLWAESEPGRGSLFCFTAEFGLEEDREERCEPEALRCPPPAARERLRVLVAEDNPLNQVFAKALLERLGHEAVLASDGEEALRALSRESFDVVLMDVQMPVIDGSEATRRIRAGEVPGCPPGVPIIAVTAHALHGDRERFLAAGMDDYLSKPFDPESLEDALRRAVALRRRAHRGAQEGGSDESGGGNVDTKGGRERERESKKKT